MPGDMSPGEAGIGEHEGVPPDAAGRPRLEWEFLLAVRRAGSVMQILGAAAAERLGINTTDLNCLNIVALTGPMTAGELARTTGLTTASITGVLDRLEESGFVRRERDTHDRRRVVIHLNYAGSRQVGPVFAPLVKAWRAALSQYSDEDLRLILEFQGQMEQVMRDQVTRLREAPAAKRDTTARRDE
jgi:DNA-binding MarR family transcriptional regulator